VLKITAGNKSVLLTGDIEKFAEKELVKNDKFNLHADILVAPHHGSKTSADDSFLHATNPTYVLFPIGYRNRYHFPNKSVIEKYKIMQVTQLDTVNSGAIQIVMNGQQSKLEFLLYRTANRHYWNN
jgi:competence protein ComEC